MIFALIYGHFYAVMGGDSFTFFLKPSDSFINGISLFGATWFVEASPSM